MFRLSEKGAQIQEMFGAIAPRYDFLNHLLSFGIDRRWRRAAVRLVKAPENGRILDVATGTGDLAFEIASTTPESLKISGVDFSPVMVGIAEEKAAMMPFSSRIDFKVAPCEDIPFPSETFDSVTIAFGIRNVVDRRLGLAEMWRVLKPGGRMVILEFSTPKSKFFRFLYHFYFRRILPVIGGMFSKYNAYKYLPDSVLEFPSTDEFCLTMTDIGLKNVRCQNLTFGIAAIYTGNKD